MSVNSYEIRVCQNCGLRYPLVENNPYGERCPVCLEFTKSVATHQLDDRPASTAMESKIHLEALLDNIRSAWNVGAIFRSADGLGVNKLYLCGITPTPENETVHKTSLGAEESIPWEYSRNALNTAKKLKDASCILIALEQDPRAMPLTQFPVPNSQPTILILGNEVTGVDPDVLDLCDHILNIPMRGRKRSLNVEVAFAIAAYILCSQIP
jgi:23S rRNA (guanosine2251-2'-O)-methyltransferase